jgi:hypothetical protein
MKLHTFTKRGWTVQPYRRAALKQYYSNYSKDNLTVLADTAVKEIVEYQGFVFEEAPRSIFRSGKLYDALSTFSPYNAPKVRWDKHVASGVALAWKCFGRPDSSPYIMSLPLNPHSIELMTSNPNGSAGLTAPSKKKKDAKMRALERAVQIIQGDKAPEPCLAFKRTQKNDKTRLVWGFPYSMTVVEGLLAYPINQHFKKWNTPMAYAKTSFAVGSKLRVGARRKKYCYSLDMSQFDASISSVLISHAFNIIGSWFDLEALEPTTRETYGDILNIISRYFVTTPIVMPDGNVYKGKRHGVPSGSYFTQIIDSIANTILCGAISSYFNMGINRRDIMVLGDDLLFFTDHKISLNAISEYAKRTFGINVHGAEKSEIFRSGEVIHFLGRDWHNGHPDLDIEEIIQKMVYPESFRHYSKDPDIKKRQVLLLLASYASTYRSAWRILERAVNPVLRNARKGELPIDTSVYVSSKLGRYLEEIDPTMLNGLSRFQRIYGIHKSNDNSFPYSGGQYLR